MQKRKSIDVVWKLVWFSIWSSINQLRLPQTLFICLKRRYCCFVGCWITVKSEWNKWSFLVFFFVFRHNLFEFNLKSLTILLKFFYNPASVKILHQTTIGLMETRFNNWFSYLFHVHFWCFLILNFSFFYTFVSVSFQNLFSFLFSSICLLTSTPPHFIGSINYDFHVKLYWTDSTCLNIESICVHLLA